MRHPPGPFLQPVETAAHDFHLFAVTVLANFLLLLSKLNQADEALRVARQGLGAIQDDPKLLNSLAWTFYQEAGADQLRYAEGWSSKAVSIEDNPERRHTLACILTRSGKTKEALAATARILEDDNFASEHVDDIVLLFAELVGADSTRKALSILEQSNSITSLEPLAIALRLILGESSNVAVEIEEVAVDVQNRIGALVKKQQKREENRATKDACLEEMG